MREVEFRDGKRTVPDHVEAMLEGIETYRMTYKQAMKAAEGKMLGDRVYQAQQALIRDHFRETP